MKWQKWLVQLEQLPPDAPEWDSYADFLVALEQLGAAKLHERAEAHTALAQALTELCRKNTVRRWRISGRAACCLLRPKTARRAAPCVWLGISMN